MRRSPVRAEVGSPESCLGCHEFADVVSPCPLVTAAAVAAAELDRRRDERHHERQG